MSKGPQNEESKESEKRAPSKKEEQIDKKINEPQEEKPGMEE